MVAPVRHGIELQTVGELHVVGLAKLLELLASQLLSLGVVAAAGRRASVCGERVKLKGLGGRTVTKWGGKSVHGGRVVEGTRAAGRLGQRVQVVESRIGRRPCDVRHLEHGMGKGEVSRQTGRQWARCRHCEL
jgi:hypothetical protein